MNQKKSETPLSKFKQKLMHKKEKDKLHTELAANEKGVMPFLKDEE